MAFTRDSGSRGGGDAEFTRDVELSRDSGSCENWGSHETWVSSELGVPAGLGVRGVVESAALPEVSARKPEGRLLVTASGETSSLNGQERPVSLERKELWRGAFGGRVRCACAPTPGRLRLAARCSCNAALGGRLLGGLPAMVVAPTSGAPGVSCRFWNGEGAWDWA